MATERKPRPLVTVPSVCQHGNHLGVEAAIEGAIIYSPACALKNGKLRAHVAGDIIPQRQ